MKMRYVVFGKANRTAEFIDAAAASNDRNMKTKIEKHHDYLRLDPQRLWDVKEEK